MPPYAGHPSFTVLCHQRQIETPYPSAAATFYALKTPRVGLVPPKRDAGYQAMGSSAGR